MQQGSNLRPQCLLALHVCCPWARGTAGIRQGMHGTPAAAAAGCQGCLFAAFHGMCMVVGACLGVTCRIGALTFCVAGCWDYASLQGQELYSGVLHAAHALANSICKGTGLGAGDTAGWHRFRVQRYLTIQQGHTQQRMFGHPCAVTWHISI